MTNIRIPTKMTQKHPVTPTPELMQQWSREYWGNDGEIPGNSERYIATQAARWGADQQLELDAKWLDTNALFNRNLTITPSGNALREAMRPKLPSLKERALAVVENLIVCDHLSEQDETTLLDALESLPE